MTTDEIRILIENDINDVVNKTTFYKGDSINYHIKSVIEIILQKYHPSKIEKYFVVSNYPEVKVMIKCNKFETVSEIKILKFERLNKLHKLNIISNLKGI